MNNKGIKDLAVTATWADLVAGNYLALDGADGTKRLSADKLLNATAQNSLAGNVAPAFDESGDTDYFVNQRVVKSGKLYIFTKNHSGVWAAADVREASEGELIDFLLGHYLSKENGVVSDAQTPNLIVYDALIDGEYFDANGKILKTSSAGFWRTPMFSVEASTSYVGYNGNLTFFDADKNYISSVSLYTTHSFTSPATAAFAGVSANVAKNIAYLYKADNAPSSWIKGERLLTTNKIKDFGKEVSKVAIPFSAGRQLFDKQGVYTSLTTSQYVAYNSGRPSANASYEWFVLPVEAGEKYVLSGYSGYNIHVAFFDKIPVDTANYVSGVLAETGVSFVVPDNSKYMTISVKIADAGAMMVQRGTNPTDYESYSLGVATENLLPRSIPMEKLGEDVVEAFGTRKKVVTIGSTGCDYTNICKAVKENQNNTIFKLAAESFDIEAAYKAEYGSSFFVNYTKYADHPGDPMYRGLNLGIGCEIYGQPNTKLVFNYNGANPDVAQYFSILSLTDNNIVNGITFVLGGKLRYAIHDDYSTIIGATNIVEHCVFKGTTSDPGRPYIGTGMGKASAYIYRDCVFSGTSTRAIGLHNNSREALGRVEIYNCYAGDDIYIFHHGTSTEKSPVMVHGCKAKKIILTWTDRNIYPNENMELFAWNNETSS